MIVLADFGMGNIHSIEKALKLYYDDVVFTDDPEKIARADGLVIPGDGAFDHAMENLEDHHLRGALEDFHASGRPVLAICIGFQIMFENSEEGKRSGLGWLRGSIKKFRPENPGVKIPHMGWNQVHLPPAEKRHPYLNGVPDQEFFYFIHSFHANWEPGRVDFDTPGAEQVQGFCEYGGIVFPAICWRDNLFATQFHPEKSFHSGLKIIENFCAGLKTPVAGGPS